MSHVDYLPVSTYNRGARCQGVRELELGLNHSNANLTAEGAENAEGKNQKESSSLILSFISAPSASLLAARLR